MPVLNDIEVLENIHSTRASKFIRRVDIPQRGVEESNGFSTFKRLTTEEMIDIGQRILLNRNNKNA